MLRWSVRGARMWCSERMPGGSVFTRLWSVCTAEMASGSWTWRLAELSLPPAPRIEDQEAHLKCVSHLPGTRESVPTDHCAMSPLHRRIHPLDNNIPLLLLSCCHHPLHRLRRRLPVLWPPCGGSRALLRLCLHPLAPHPAGPRRTLVYPRA